MKTRKESPITQSTTQKRKAISVTDNNKKPKLELEEEWIDDQDRTTSSSSSIDKKGKKKMIETPNNVLQETESIQQGLDETSRYSDDESDDDIDWETIPLLPHSQSDHETDMDTMTYKDIDIVMEQAPRPVSKKSHWERSYQRILHEWMHHSHVVLLIAHYKLRNRWCLNNELQTLCYSIIPEHIKRIQNNKSKESLKKGIQALLKWWNNDIFELTGPGLLTQNYNYYEQTREGYKTLEEWIEKNHTSNKDGDYIKDLSTFKQMISSSKRTLSGTRDTSAELFVSILRSCGYDTRLVSSLQPISYKVPVVNKSQNATPTINDEDKNESKPLFNFRVRPRAYVDPNVKLKNPKGKPPTVWAEVYCKETKRWICIDPIRGHIDKPTWMEPASSDQDNKLSFVLAFDHEEYITDVTRRYTYNMERVNRVRDRPLTRREINGGIQLWSERLLSVICYKPRLTERDQLEAEDLENQSLKEVMPTSISGFKNHPLFALERHLLKFEVIYPKHPILGAIRGEKIYPRSCVKMVSTSEQYYKQGKKIKEGEQPIKMVKANAVTIEKKRLKELAKQEGGDLMVACYGEWQTEPYIPPPVVNGVLPKNRFGNIDLFTPSMLPKGAAHIPVKGIEKIAKKLGIDYAVAVVDFDFVKMRAVPVTNGILVAEEQQWILLEAWEEYEKDKAIKAIEEHKRDVMIRWRKLIKSILIQARLDG
ncbi:uncharacterized protein BX663DRAFT_510807 [Cokeromyces recurvatus]|uniref:uncharacterized protein n=1 Tax=Cokeromyces recurvatus TaxID=90255 RepID=UPI002220DCC6|nr:uncharacterized protein BX663DRAFT_510807 [Cokeromyces recurvatus]KAI7902347.1 hypothetical protein BX663DRAFT_510807 [Cokeromyces recurvatus]